MKHARFQVSCSNRSAGLCFAIATPQAQAQVSVNIGVAPDCPYGYYDTPPYGCAPYGYYGPEWFSGGVFIGAGPGFMAPNTSTATSITTTILTWLSRPISQPRRTIADYHPEHMENFHGNEMRDGHGHVGGEHEGHH